MKKLATLLLAAGLIFGASQPQASATDFKASGIWDFNFEWNNTSFYKSDKGDTFNAKQRLRTQIEAIASESLKGVLFLEIGDQNWGRASQGASIGTDGTVIEVRYSYIDWVVPNTDLKVRMGLQPIALPSFVGGGSPILDHDAAGILVNYQFNENVGLSAFWMRAEHGNSSYKHGDDLDVLGLTLPLNGDGWALTPWGAYGFVGRNSLVNGDWDTETGLLPQGIYGDDASLSNSNNKVPAWWLGVGGELTYFDPFRIAFDFAYGKVHWDDISQFMDLDRAGWLAMLSVDYKMDNMTPGLMFWYSSGDDSDPYDGSERIPIMRSQWAPTSFGFDGGFGISSCDILGVSPGGSWGVLAQIQDISFMEDLSHTLRVGYYIGTNDEDAVRNGTTLFADSFSYPIYLTRKDHMLEVNLENQYKIYENLIFALDMGYLHLDYDDDVWRYAMDTDNIEKNVWKVGVNLRYAF